MIKAEVYKLLHELFELIKYMNIKKYRSHGTCKRCLQDFVIKLVCLILLTKTNFHTFK